MYVAVDVKTKKIILMMKVTDEHVHDSKALPELIEKNIIKSNDEISSIGKLLFADDGASTMVMIFLDVWQQTMNLVALYQIKKKNAQVN
jgi:hypothetical protein